MKEAEETEEVRERIPVSIGSKIIGKTIGEVEKSFKICILELENTSDRAFVFSWETRPDRSTTIKPEDEIVVFGKAQRIRRFSGIAASLN